MNIPQKRLKINGMIHEQKQRQQPSCSVEHGNVIGAVSNSDGLLNLTAFPERTLITRLEKMNGWNAKKKEVDGMEDDWTRISIWVKF